MRKSESIKIGGIVLPLAVALGACGGGGGEPGGSPQANNSPATRLHPESYVELWWNECRGGPCQPPGAVQAAHR